LDRRTSDIRGSIASGCHRAGAKNPHFLYEYSRSYNWDDGFDIANAVADNPHCDLGTALSLFWLAGAESLLTKSIDRDAYNGEWFDFCTKMITRISSRHYSPGPVGFEAELGRVQIYKLRKLGIDPVFYTAVEAFKETKNQ
jgi:Domain of unknown function (DUF4274)